MAFRISLTIAGVLLLVSVLVFTNFGAGTTVVYDCRMAEWHPDFPKDVKEECRRIIKEQLTSKRLTT